MFPVCTGMNRFVLAYFGIKYYVPRMHGDEPTSNNIAG